MSPRITEETEPELVSERKGGVLVLRLNRPGARNSLCPTLVKALGATLRGVDADESVLAVVIVGTGDRAFCAGMDLRAFTESSDADPDFDREYVQFLREGIGKPVIGAANGTAVAGGFELLLGCDMVVAADAAKFGLPEVKRGLFAAGGGTMLSRRVPLAVALELGLTGDYVDAQRAYELGLVNKVVPQPGVLDAAVDLAGRIAANGPLAVRVTKRLMVDAAYSSRSQAWGQRDARFDEVFSSADAKEGARAFVEKRTPIWTGK